MSDYAELKARLTAPLYQWPGEKTEIGMEAAAAIDALEREVEQLVAECNDIIKQLERFAKRHQDHLVMGAQVRQRAEAAEARVKRLEEALRKAKENLHEIEAGDMSTYEAQDQIDAALQEDKNHG